MDEDNNRTSISSPYLEQDHGYAAFPTNDTPAFDSCVSIRVISYRKYNHDTEGVSLKAVLDGLVAFGILVDDSAKQIKEVTFESRKSTIERTVIEITGSDDEVDKRT